MTKDKNQSFEIFNSFGELLRFARKRAHLTQNELGILIGYHHSYISYIEKNLRTPDKAILLGRIIPALDLQNEPELIEKMLSLLELSLAKNSYIPKQLVINHTTSINYNLLPKPLTPILGRAHEEQLLLNMLNNPEMQLITITGAPGVGKTRMALHMANSLQEKFREGAIFVDLIPIQNPEFVSTAIASALSKNKTATQDLSLALQDKELLLILDNFEHVLNATTIITSILENNSNIKILTTSREPLCVRGEHEFPLTPLHLASKFDDDSPAFQLFVERAKSINPSFQADEKNASDIAQICFRLDGLPLAIEIAAAQTRTMNPSIILQKLSDVYKWPRLERDIPTQQKTLENAIQWSYAQLPEAEKTLFERLSIFLGSFSLDAVEAICSDEVICPSSTNLTLLNQLVSKSLIVADTVHARFKLLESLRLFSSSQLRKSKTFNLISEKHCEYYLNYAKSLQAYLKQEKIDDIAWIESMKQEQHNFRTALTWCVNTVGHTKLASSLMLTLSQFMMLSGNLQEARIWFDKILALEDLDIRDSIRLLHIAGDYAGKQGENEIARKYQTEGLNLAKEIHEDDLIYLSVEGMARAEYREGNFQSAIDLFEEALAHKRNGSNKIAIIRTLNYLAISNRELGKLERALEVGLESIDICRNVNAKPDLVQALIGVGEVYFRRNEFKQALEYQAESLLLSHQLGFLHGIAINLTFMAYSFHNLGKSELATQMESASQKIKKEIGVKSATPASIERNKKLLEKLKGKLGEKFFSEEWLIGEQLTIDEIIHVTLSACAEESIPA